MDGDVRVMRAFALGALRQVHEWQGGPRGGPAIVF